MRNIQRTQLLNFPTPWNRVLLEEPLLPRFFNIRVFSACYASKGFITVFTTAHRLSLSCAKLIQSTPPHPASFDIYFNTILLFMLTPSQQTLSFTRPYQQYVCMHSSSPYVPHAKLILSYMIRPPE